MQLRDPVMYRIRRGHHWRTGDEWVIYPTYDWAHGQSDAIEGVTHSLCTLEFDSHRALYDWYLSHLPLPGDQPRQTEFARLELTHTITSKRRLAGLVNDGVVDGWDDPRMPTLRGLRRRGYPARAIRSLLQLHRGGPHQQPPLDRTARVVHPPRAQRNGVAPHGCAAPTQAGDHQLARRQHGQAGRRTPRGGQQPGERRPTACARCRSPRSLYIERDDFMEEAPPKYFRLTPGREVRLRSAYLVTCTGFAKDDDGNVVEVHCTYDPATSGGNAPDGRKVKSTMHWVSADHAVDATVALYERLFTAEVPGETTGEPFDDLNPESRELLTGLQGGAGVGRAPRRSRSCSSSGSGTSPTTRPRRCCSTARSGCATNGPTSRRGRDCPAAVRRSARPQFVRHRRCESPGGALGATAEGHTDDRCTVDDVSVRHDEAAGVEDHASARALARAAELATTDGEDGVDRHDGGFYSRQRGCHVHVVGLEPHTGCRRRVGRGLIGAGADPGPDESHARRQGRHRDDTDNPPREADTFAAAARRRRPIRRLRLVSRRSW